LPTAEVAAPADEKGGGVPASPAGQNPPERPTLDLLTSGIEEHRPFQSKEEGVGTEREVAYRSFRGISHGRLLGWLTGASRPVWQTGRRRGYFDIVPFSVHVFQYKYDL